MRFLTEHLDAHRAKYVIVVHSPAYSPGEILAGPDLPGWQLIRVHVAHLDSGLALAVVAEGAELQLAKLASATGSREARLANDEEVARRFPACEVGAVPPFGGLFKVPTYVDERLAREQRIAFFGGKHAQVMAMAFRDYFKLAEPRLIELSKW